MYNKKIFNLGAEFKILSYLRTNIPKNMHVFSKDINMTYAHLHKILKLMDKEDIIKLYRKDKGRRDISLKLTIKGRVMANKIKDLNAIIENGRNGRKPK